MICFYQVYTSSAGVDWEQSACVHSALPSLLQRQMLQSSLSNQPSPSFQVHSFPFLSTQSATLSVSPGLVSPIRNLQRDIKSEMLKIIWIYSYWSYCLLITSMLRFQHRLFAHCYQQQPSYLYFFLK